MKSNLFSYSDYKTYLKDRIRAEEKKRGFKMRIAEHLGCQPSYLSQVLNGERNVTLEQAMRLNDFFNHSSLEIRYFILLVEYARAGTTELSDFFNHQILEMQKSYSEFKNRLEPKHKEFLSTELDRQKYYSAWFYSAIHMAMFISEKNKLHQLAENFRLPLPVVVEAVQFLERSGLIENSNGTYKVVKKRLFLEKGTDHIRQHHLNWRIQALQALGRDFEENFHYSSVVAISESDYLVIRDILMKAIENLRKVIGPSKEEKVYALAVDLFRV